MGALGELTDGLMRGLAPEYGKKQDARKKDRDTIAAARLIASMGQREKSAVGEPTLPDGTFNPQYQKAQEATGRYIGMNETEAIQAEQLGKILASTQSPEAIQFAMDQTSKNMQNRNAQSQDEENSQFKLDNAPGPLPIDPMKNMTTDQKNFAQMKQEGYQGSFADYLAEKRKNSGVRVNHYAAQVEKESDIAINKINRDTFKIMNDNEDAMKSNLQDVQLMEKYSNDYDPGVFGDIKLGFMNFAEGIGLDMGKDVTAGNQMKKFSSALALKMGENLKGSTSERDLDFMKQSVLGIKDPRKVFAAMTKTYREIYEFRREINSRIGRYDQYNRVRMREVERELAEEGRNPYEKNYTSGTVRSAASAFDKAPQKDKDSYAAYLKRKGR